MMEVTRRISKNYLKIDNHFSSMVMFDNPEMDAMFLAGESSARIDSEFYQLQTIFYFD